MKKWKCIVCNYIHTGDEPPEKCPICGADKSMFIEVVEDEEKTAEELMVEKSGDTEDISSVSDTSGERKWKCTICGYIHAGNAPPEKCPACGAEKTFFVEVVDEEKEVEASASAEMIEEPPPATRQPAGTTGFITKLVVNHHLHPISVHTPNGVIPVAVVFLGLAVVSGINALELAAFFNIVFVLLTMPAVVFTGYLTWQKKFNGARTSIFITKLVCSAIAAILLGLMVCWRLIDPTIALSGGTGSWVYLSFGGVLLGAIGIAGHLGGKLVFAASK